MNPKDKEVTTEFHPKYIVLFLKEIIFAIAKGNTNAVIRAVAAAMLSPIDESEEALYMCNAEYDVLRAAEAFIEVDKVQVSSLKVIAETIKGISIAMKASEKVLVSYQIKRSLELATSLLGEEGMRQVAQAADKAFEEYTKRLESLGA